MGSLSRYYSRTLSQATKVSYFEATAERHAKPSKQHKTTVALGLAPSRRSHSAVAELIHAANDTAETTSKHGGTKAVGQLILDHRRGFSKASHLGLLDRPTRPLSGIVPDVVPATTGH